WVKSAVALLRRCDQAVRAGHVDADLLALDARVTDCNSAFFDAANDFHGAIAGCHEVLRRQGLLAGIWCLDPAETLSPGQSEASSFAMLASAPHGRLASNSAAALRPMRSAASLSA